MGRYRKGEIIIHTHTQRRYCYTYTRAPSAVVHAVALATVFTAGAPRRQLTRARPRMGGASLVARAQPSRTPPYTPRPCGGGGAKRTLYVRDAATRSWPLRGGTSGVGGNGRALSEHHLARIGSRSLRTAAADQSVYVLRAGRYVNGLRACV